MAGVALCIAIEYSLKIYYSLAALLMFREEKRSRTHLCSVPSDALSLKIYQRNT